MEHYAATPRRVVITGLGTINSLGHNTDDFWASLLAGKCGIDRVTHFDVTAFASQIGAEVRNWDPALHMDPKEARRNDRYTHFGYCAARQAVKDAGLDMTKEDGDRVGVIIGSGIGGMATYEEQVLVLAEKGPRKVSPFTIPSLIGNICSGMVAIDLGARGPNFGVVSACATATHSLGEAFHTIRRGEADVMVAGGTEASITPFAYAGFCSMKAMSTNNEDPQHACRPFDAKRDGFIMGEGAGILVLESLEHAQARGARIYCELGGYAASCDAHHITMPDHTAAGTKGIANPSTTDRRTSTHERIGDHLTGFRTLANQYFGDRRRFFGGVAPVNPGNRDHVGDAEVIQLSLSFFKEENEFVARAIVIPHADRALVPHQRLPGGNAFPAQTTRS